MATVRDASAIYQKEEVGIAVYEDNRKPDGNPDSTRYHVRYWKLSNGGEIREQVTDPDVIAELEAAMIEASIKEK